MKLWLVVDVGCLECGKQSRLAGVWDDEEKAHSQAGQIESTYPSEWFSSREACVFEWDGQLGEVAKPQGWEED